MKMIDDAVRGRSAAGQVRIADLPDSTFLIACRVDVQTFFLFWIFVFFLLHSLLAEHMPECACYCFEIATKESNIGCDSDERIVRILVNSSHWN